MQSCKTCGKSGCVVNSENEKMGYCFRCAKTFFSEEEVFFSGSAQAKKKKKSGDNQGSFDFVKPCNMFDFEQ